MRHFPSFARFSEFRGSGWRCFSTEVTCQLLFSSSHRLHCPREPLALSRGWTRFRCHAFSCALCYSLGSRYRPTYLMSQRLCLLVRVALLCPEARECQEGHWRAPPPGTIQTVQQMVLFRQGLPSWQLIFIRPSCLSLDLRGPSRVVTCMQPAWLAAGPAAPCRPIHDPWVFTRMC